METVSESARDLDPGTGARSRATSIWIGAVFLAASVALASLGGGALVGILALVTGGFVGPGRQPLIEWSPHVETFVFALYGVSGGCFLGAAVLLVLGIRSLLRAEKR
jgi:hypothetical protein